MPKTEPAQSLVIQKLLAVQAELKAPKGLYNKFGKFYYRSKESILEAAKPLCNAQGLILTITDRLEEKDGRFYICAIASVSCWESGETFSASGWAREAESKKGMDEAQITGSTSSYAGKYALNNLFAIDDNQDADDEDYPKEPAKPAKTPAKEAKAPAKPAKTLKKKIEDDDDIDDEPSDELLTLSPGIKKAMMKAIDNGDHIQVHKSLAKYADGKAKDAILDYIEEWKEGEDE